MGVRLPNTRVQEYQGSKTQSADGFSYCSSSAAALSNGSFLTFADGLLSDRVIYGYDERILGWGFRAGQGVKASVTALW